VSARVAAGASEPVGEDAALEVAAELALHLWRHHPVVMVSVAALGEPGLEVFLDAAIVHAFARATRPVAPGYTFPGPEPAVHAFARVEREGSSVGGDGRRWPLAAGTTSCG
jgi:hypothetical protein